MDHHPDSSRSRALTDVIATATDTVIGIEIEAGVTDETIGSRGSHVVSVTLEIPVITEEMIVGVTIAKVSGETTGLKISVRNVARSALQSRLNDRRSCFDPNRAPRFPKNLPSRTRYISANLEMNL
jgi:hypothetical protein